jgi:steroid 5-alpha reductase family enzyme
MSILLGSLFVLSLYMTVLYILALLLKNNGVADIGYGVAFLVFIFATVFQTGLSSPLLTIVLCAVTIWAVRLSFRIFLKNKNKPEDFRYKAWRDAWGSTFLVRSFLQIYMLQGAVIAVVASPVVVALIFPRAEVVPFFVSVGMVIWVCGFFFEAVGDYQLDAFIKNPAHKGQIMTSGLWKYSRHPNYFGESTMWIGIFVASLGFSVAAALCIWSPLLITYLLLKVSGVPLLEKRFEGNPSWEAYKAKTSVFIPLPPQK